jgi:hypothetical protein
MKQKTFLYLIFAAMAGMGSCTEKMPHVFDLSPDERAQEYLEQYSQTLCSAPCGWLVTVGTQDVGTAGGAYRFWMTFKPNNRVTMYADIDVTTAATPKESSYRLKQIQYPTLMFDTYTYIHMPDDPGVVIAGATSGLGLLSDSDVSLIEDASGNEFRAVGRKRQCPFIFTRATPEDTLAIVQGAFATARGTAAARWTNLKYPTIATTKTQLQMTVSERLSSYTYPDENNEVQTVFIPSFAELDANSIRLVTPFKYKDVEFDRIAWNDNSKEYTISINGEPHLVYDNRQPSYPLAFGPGKTYNTLTVEKSVLNSAGGSIMVQPFLGIYDRMYSEANTSAGASISKFTLAFMRNEQYEEQMHLNVSFAGSAGGSKTGEAIFNVSREADAMYFTSYRTPDSEAGRQMDTIGHAIAGSLLSFLLHSGSADSAGVGSNKTAITPSGNTFKADWTINNVQGLTQVLGCLRKTDDPANFMPGTLGKQE